MAEVVEVAVGSVANDVTCTATLATPAAAGNLLVAVMTNNRSSSNAVIPADFVEVGRQSTSGAANLTIARKLAVGGETAVTYTASAGTSRMLLSVFEVTGIDEAASLPIEVLFATAATAGTTIATPTIPAGGDVYIAALSTGTGAASGTAWGGWTNGFVDVVSHDGGVASNNVAQSCSYKNSTAAESSTQSWTGAATSVAAILRLQSAAVGPPAVSAALGGSGTVAATGTLTAARAANLSGAGTLMAAVAAPEWDGSVAWNGADPWPGPHTAPPVVVAAALSGSGGMSTGQRLAVARTGALSGSGALTTSQRLHVARAAALSGAGTLSATSSPRWVRAVALSGSGTLQATPFGTALAPLGGAGTLTTTQRAALARTAALTGAGTLTALVSGGAQALAAALTGAGVLSVITPAVPIDAQLRGEGLLSTYSISLLRVGTVTPATIRLGGVMPIAIYQGYVLVWKP